jgi:carboxymethylenebutenolidase
MNLFQRYLVEEFAEDYQEGHLSRREALKMIAGVTGSLLLATTILAGCTPPDETLTAAATDIIPTGAGPEATAASAATAAPSATAESTATPGESPTETAAPETAPAGEVDGQDVQIPSGDAAIIAYLARPAGSGPHPVVLVCHENRGLTEHIKDVTRRLAQSGYVALAVDLLSRQGGTSSLSSGDVPGLLGNTSPDQFAADFRSGWEYLKTLNDTQPERVGMVGFCFGGGVTWLVATRMPELRAAVPFYGPHPLVEDVPNIQAAVLGIYAGNDQRINQGIPPIEEAMAQNSKLYEKVIYDGADHAFHNDTSTRYNPEAAADAWRRTLEWFELYV